MVNYKKIPLQVSVHLKYLYHDKGLRGKDLLRAYPMYSRASVYRHAASAIENDVEEDKRKQNKGRPVKLSERDRRAILRQITILRETVGNFTVKRLRTDAGIATHISDETVRRVLRKQGIRYLHSRKKGLLTKKDLAARLKFARKVNRLLTDEFWKKGIAFYLDGVSFYHKYNPHGEARSSRNMAWRKRSEGLHPTCTAKGSHVGAGGRVAHFMVAICFDKGVILCQQYDGRINGEMFAEFISEHFNETFEKSVNPRGRLFLQDGDPSQNSKKAMEALRKVRARKFSIPPRSPDLNPIENVFNYVKSELRLQALNRNITRETFDQFSLRIKETFLNLSVSYINKTIASMDERISAVIKGKGKRSKY